MDDLFLDEQIPYVNGAVIKVVGVGGAGGNAVANMVDFMMGRILFVLETVISLRKVRQLQTLLL